MRARRAAGFQLPRLSACARERLFPIIAMCVLLEQTRACVSIAAGAGIHIGVLKLKEKEAVKQ